MHKIGETWIEDESVAYTARGAQIRKGRAIYSDGKVRAVYCGIPDTFFSIPAHGRIAGKYVRGFLTCDESGFHFNEYRPQV